MKKEGLTKWIPPKGSLELPRENIKITNEKDEPVKIRIEVLDKSINHNLKGTDHDNKEPTNQ